MVITVAILAQVCLKALRSFEALNPSSLSLAKMQNVFGFFSKACSALQPRSPKTSSHSAINWVVASGEFFEGIPVFDDNWITVCAEFVQPSEFAHSPASTSLQDISGFTSDGTDNDGASGELFDGILTLDDNWITACVELAHPPEFAHSSASTSLQDISGFTSDGTDNDGASGEFFGGIPTLDDNWITACVELAHPPESTHPPASVSSQDVADFIPDDIGSDVASGVLFESMPLLDDDWISTYAELAHFPESTHPSASTSSQDIFGFAPAGIDSGVGLSTNRF